MRRWGNSTLLVAVFLIFVALLLLYTQTAHFGRFYYPYHHRTAIESHAYRHNLDALLVAAVIRVESRFRSDAISRKGAVGLMQIMPATGKWIASQTGVNDFSPDMLLDPETNIGL